LTTIGRRKYRGSMCRIEFGKRVLLGSSRVNLTPVEKMLSAFVSEVHRSAVFRASMGIFMKPNWSLEEVDRSKIQTQQCGTENNCLGIRLQLNVHLLVYEPDWLLDFRKLIHTLEKRYILVGGHLDCSMLFTLALLRGDRRALGVVCGHISSGHIMHKSRGECDKRAST
jgi:hypothetical protein